MVNSVVNRWKRVLLLLLLLLQIFKEGSPSAVAALQGALHLNIKYI